MRKAARSVLSLFMCVALMLPFFGTSAKAMSVQKRVGKDTSEADQFLIKTGMPQDILRRLDQETKQYIYDTERKNGNLKNAIYSGYSTKNAAMTSSKEKAGLMAAGDKATYKIGTVRPNNSIPSDQLVFSTVAFQESDGYYSIYPSFEWTARTNIKNDAFAFALPEGWSMKPNSYNLRVWDRLTADYSWQYVEDLPRPSTANFYGLGWKFGSYYGGNGLAKGNAYFFAKPTSGTPDRRISLNYVDSPAYFVSVGISIGPLSVSFNVGGDSNEAGEMIYF